MKTAINTRQNLKKAQKLFVNKYTKELQSLTKEFRMLMGMEQDSEFFKDSLPYKNRLNFVRVRIEKLRAKLMQARNVI